MADKKWGIIPLSVCLVPYLKFKRMVTKLPSQNRHYSTPSKTATDGLHDGLNRKVVGNVNETITHS